MAVTSNVTTHQIEYTHTNEREGAIAFAKLGDDQSTDVKYTGTRFSTPETYDDPIAPMTAERAAEMQQAIHRYQTWYNAQPEHCLSAVDYALGL